MRSSSREEVVEVFDALDAAMDRAVGLSFEAVTTPERLGLLERCETLRRRLPAVEHPLINQIVGVDRADGQRVWLSSSCCLLDPADPAHSAVLLSFVDVTAQYITSQRLSYQARHDALTGLPNRNQLLDRVRHALASGYPMLSAIMFIDVDNLKIINDSLGHHAGDHALRLTAQRLHDALRSHDVVGRLGGDEFVALLTQPLDAEDLQLLARRVHATIAEPTTIDRQEVRVSVSIGVTSVEPTEAREAEDLLRDADLAMYDAKATGAGQTSFFSDQLRHSPRQSCHGE